MRPRKDEGNKELSRVLTELAAEGVDITAQEVARRHSTLKHASDFTRNADRNALLTSARQTQLMIRAEAGKPHDEKASGLAVELEAAQARVSELEEQVKALASSHAECVKAVMRHGGMQALERFWQDYKAIGDSVREADGMPTSAEVTPIRGT